MKLQSISNITVMQCVYFLPYHLLPLILVITSPYHRANARQVAEFYIILC